MIKKCLIIQKRQQMINKIQIILLLPFFMVSIPVSYSQLMNNNITNSEQPIISNSSPQIELKNNLFGTFNDDRIIGTTGIDVIIGLPGSDNIRGGNGTDVIQGNEDADRLYGENDNDIIQGGLGSDQIYGGDGDDILTGGLDDDLVIGENGNDKM